MNLEQSPTTAINAQRMVQIRQALACLEPTVCELIDESTLHHGHAGAASGGGHFRLMLVSAQFNGIKRIARHRLVYDAVGVLMHTEIHALTINALAPSELPSETSTLQ
jgi:BolA protein